MLRLSLGDLLRLRVCAQRGVSGRSDRTQTWHSPYYHRVSADSGSQVLSVGEVISEVISSAGGGLVQVG